MGTPLSSLVGWIEVMKDEARVGDSGAVLPRDLYEELVQEIGRDAERINRVAARFSQIGSRPSLGTGAVDPVVRPPWTISGAAFPGTWSWSSPRKPVPCGG